MQARTGRTNISKGINTSRSGFAPRICNSPTTTIITNGLVISKYFKRQFNERIVGKSKWAREWKRVMAKAIKKHNKGRRGNPELGLETLDVSRMSERFHGRPSLDEFDIDETEVYDKNQAVLGDLVELNVIDSAKPTTEFTISFKKNRPLLCCNAEGSQLEIIGGDQSLPFPNQTNKYLVTLGEIRTISYYTDKHHLEGPKNQKDGVEYEHEFGEEGGNRPVAVYNTRSNKILIVGGDYTIEDEGIAN